MQHSTRVYKERDRSSNTMRMPSPRSLQNQNATACTSASTLTRGFQTATDTPVIREEGAPDVPPPGRVGAVGIGNGPAILSKFMVSSFKMSVLDKARLISRVTRQNGSSYRSYGLGVILAGEGSACKQ